MKKERLRKIRKRLRQRQEELIDAGSNMVAAYQNMVSSRPQPTATLAIERYIAAKRRHAELNGYPYQEHPLEINRRAQDARAKREQEARRVEEQILQRIYAKRERVVKAARARKARKKQRSRKV